MNKTNLWVPYSYHCPFYTLCNYLSFKQFRTMRSRKFPRCVTNILVICVRKYCFAFYNGHLGEIFKTVFKFLEDENTFINLKNNNVQISVVPMRFRVTRVLCVSFCSWGVCLPECITDHMPGGLHSGGSASGLGEGWHQSEFASRGWADLPYRQTWDTTGYGQQAGGTHPTGMLSSIDGFYHTITCASSQNVLTLCKTHLYHRHP